MATISKGEVIFIERLKNEAVIRQQIALNSRMYEIGKISKGMFERAQKILNGRLASLLSSGIISNSKMIFLEDVHGG